MKIYVDSEETVVVDYHENFIILLNDGEQQLCSGAYDPYLDDTLVYSTPRAWRVGNIVPARTDVGRTWLGRLPDSNEVHLFQDGALPAAEYIIEWMADD